MISVIVPAYNAKNHIGNCLRALQQQTGVDDEYEVIVVDDGSTDGTGEVARSFGVRVIVQPHRGPGAARNHGAEEAQGDLLLFTDADCEPATDWISTMVRAFVRPEVAGAKGAYRSRQRSVVARFVQLEFEDKYDHISKSKYIDFVDTYSAAYRRQVFLAGGGFDTSFRRTSLEDQDFSFRLAATGHKMIFIPDAIVYHQHPDTLLNYLRRKFWVGYWRVMIHKRHPDKILSDSRTPPALRIQVVLGALLIPSVFAPLITAWFHPLTIMALFIISTVPFTIKSIRKDVATGILAPVFLLTRALALGAGFVCAKLRLVSVKRNE